MLQRRKEAPILNAECRKIDMDNKNPLPSVCFEQNGADVIIKIRSDEDLIEFVDFETGQWFIEHVTSLTDTNSKRVMFDMNGLRKINSALLGLIVQICKEVNPQSIDVQVINVNPSIRKVMELTRLTHLLPDPEQNHG